MMKTGRDIENAKLYFIPPIHLVSDEQNDRYIFEMHGLIFCG